MTRSSPPPDGRNIDPRLGTLSGEAAGIVVRDPAAAWPLAPGVHPTVAPLPGAANDAVADAAVAAVGDDLPTYYDLPVVKAPPWQWYVPAYFAVGGLAGAAGSLAGALELTGAHHPLVARLRWIAALGDAAGGVLLIADLGRPARFHHMLRVFRPTSPMNLGTWILSAAGTSSALGVLAILRDRRTGALERLRDRGASVLASVRDRGASALDALPALRAHRRASPGVWRKISGRRASAGISFGAGLVSVVSIVSGTMLATYTGVLIGNTAIPIWHATRRRLPLWFAALSAASLGSVLELAAPGLPITRIYSVAGKAAQIATAASVARAARAATVAAPLQHGRAGSLWRGATWLGIASLAATATTLLRPSRPRSWLAGSLGLAAAVLSRFAITEAGRASAADPRATFAPQRAAAASAASASDAASTTLSAAPTPRLVRRSGEP